MTAEAGVDESTASIAVELRKEASTMALYLAICLLAALTAVPDDDAEQAGALLIVWGTTIGLAIAHWFAFHVSARLVAAGSVRRHDAQAALAQLVGAAVLALLATVPILLFPTSAELDASRVVLAAFIGLVGYLVAQASHASRAISIAYAVAVLTIAIGVVFIKNTLIGH